MEIKILDGISINQNVIILVLSYIGVLYADNYNMQCVGCVCWFIFLLATLSTIVSLGIYTYEYVIKKYQTAQTKTLSNRAIAQLIDNKIKNNDLKREDIEII